MEEHYFEQSAPANAVGDVPNHPNLLPARFVEDAHPEMEKYVIKPIFSREGANVSIIENGKTIEEVEGPYGEEGMIVQQFCQLPSLATATR